MVYLIIFNILFLSVPPSSFISKMQKYNPDKDNYNERYRTSDFEFLSPTKSEKVSLCLKYRDDS